MHLNTAEMFRIMSLNLGIIQVIFICFGCTLIFSSRFPTEPVPLFLSGLSYEDCNDFCPTETDKCHCKLELVDNISYTSVHCCMIDKMPTFKKPHCISNLSLNFQYIGCDLEPLQSLINGGMFKNFTNVVRLYLKSVQPMFCLLSPIVFSKITFLGLSKLKSMELVFLYIIIHQHTFNPLQQLQHLILNATPVEFKKNSIIIPSLIAMDVFFSAWTNLSNSHIHIPNIKALRLFGLNILVEHHFTIDLFQCLRNYNLQILMLKGLNIQEFQGILLHNVAHLTMMDVSDNEIKCDALFNLTAGLVYTKVQSFYMNHVGLFIDLKRQSTELDIIRKNLAILQPPLLEFHIDGSYIKMSESMDLFTTYLPQLRRLSIADSELPDMYMMDIFTLSHLLYLNISNTKTYGSIYSIDLPKLEVLDMSLVVITADWPTQLYLNINSIIQKIWMSSVTAVTGEVNIACFDVVSNLQIIDFSNIYHDASHYIRSMTFNHSNCTFPSLTTLKLSNSKIGASLVKETVDNILRSMNMLEHFDISFTNIGDTGLHHDTFQRQTNLKVLNLSKTMISHLTPSIQHMKKLTILNLTHNNISCLSRGTTWQLNKIQTNSNLSLDLSGNTLKCNCECMNFLIWLSTTNVNILNSNSLRCIKNSEFHTLDNTTLLAMISDLKETCLSQEWLKIQLAISVLALLSVTVSAFTFRIRYVITYLWLKMRMRAEHRRAFEQNHMFLYDAFLCYNQADYPWVTDQLLPNLHEETGEVKLCFHHRDFVPGLSIIGSIIEALHNSQHAILVVSANSATSAWWRFELNMAHQVSLERQHNMIICVFLEEIPVGDLPVTIGRILRLFTCLRWPRSQEGRDLFWMKLKKALQHK